MQKNEDWVYDNEGINYDDIPEITDFSKFTKNPFAGQFKNGYTVIVEHENHEEIITISKFRRDKTSETKAV